MCKIDEEKKLRIWQKARVVDGYDSTKYRQDACGAWIVYTDYQNRDSDYGWEIDHIYPVARLKEANVSQQEIDDIKNLRPLNWRNNVSKASDFPSYRAVFVADGNRNVSTEKEFIVNRETRETIKEHFKDYNIGW